MIDQQIEKARSARAQGAGALRRGEVRALNDVKKSPWGISVAYGAWFRKRVRIKKDTF